MPRFTVLIPTHDHADTLFFAVPSVLAQTKQDLEIFIVGDGVPNRTREVVKALTQQDQRIRFFDNPKGPRHGEIHRHRALQEAAGEFVCYLTDDDLWLPDHLETMESLLEQHDLAHTLEVCIRPDGSLFGWLSDASWPGFADAMRRREVAGIGLPCGGHRLDAYRRLPHGWRTTPSGTPTDHYMWLQFLEQPWCRAVSSPRPTVIHFDSPERKGQSPAQRLAELATWSARLADAERRRGLLCELMEKLAWQAHRDSLHHQAVAQRLADTLVADGKRPVVYEPGTELQFGAGGKGSAYLLYGFSKPEDWGVWSDHAQAVLALPLAEPWRGDAELWLRHGAMVDPRLPYSRISLTVNGSQVGHWTHRPEAKMWSQSIVLPTALVQGARELVLGFRMHDAVRPCDISASTDSRRLGLALMSLCLRRRTTTGEGCRPESDAPARTGPH